MDVFLVKVLLIGILSFIVTLFFPWYTPAIVAFACGIGLSNKAGSNFLAGFFGVGLFWLVYVLFLDLRNDHLLGNKIALLFSENLKMDISSVLLIVITTLLGALLGGLSCLAGALIMDDGSKRRLRKAVKNGRYSLKI